MVEQFFNKELADISFEVEALEEWKSIASELGLENQLNLTKGKESPVPYPFINECMRRVYETLCPRHVDFKDYKVTPIPLEVLKQISFSVREKHFSKIEIWYDDKSPDPVVVGHCGYYYVYDKNYNNAKDVDGKELRFSSDKEAKEYKELNSLYSTSYKEDGKYLVARWGDELRPFNELKALAVERFIDNEGGEMQREIKTLTEKLKLIRENAVSYMNANIDKHQATSASRGW